MLVKAPFTSGAVPLVNCVKREEIGNPVQWILVNNIEYAVLKVLIFLFFKD